MSSAAELAGAADYLRTTNGSARIRRFPLSQKYIDFINTTDVRAEFLEGTTASGKTTVGAGVKFMRMVSASSKRLHIIAGLDTGTIEKNILNQDNGLLDIHRDALYFGNGDKENKLPHVKFEGKIIYVLGYDNRDRWKKILGGQYGCVFLDEINTADIEFVRKLSTRNDYLLATLNPDGPVPALSSCLPMPLTRQRSACSLIDSFKPDRKPR